MCNSYNNKIEGHEFEDEWGLWEDLEGRDGGLM